MILTEPKDQKSKDDFLNRMISADDEADAPLMPFGPAPHREPPSPQVQEHRRLVFGRFTWIDDDPLFEEQLDELVEMLNYACARVADPRVVDAEVRLDNSDVRFILFGPRSTKLYEGILVRGNIDALSSMRIQQIEDMDPEDENTNQSRLRPRWAEEVRPKKQVKLRLQPALISEVASAAHSEGMTRNDWIEESIRKALAARKPKPE